MSEAAVLARRKGVRLHTHLAETDDEEDFCREQFGCTPVEYAEQLGWLGDDVWLAHGVHLDDAAIARLGATGTGVAHCPSSNARLGAGAGPGPRPARRRRAGGPGRGRLGLAGGVAPGRGAAPGAVHGPAARRPDGAVGPRVAAARHHGRRPLPRPRRTTSARSRWASSPTWCCGGSTGSATTASTTRSRRWCFGPPAPVELALVGGRPVVERGELVNADAEHAGPARPPGAPPAARRRVAVFDGAGLRRGAPAAEDRYGTGEKRVRGESPTVTEILSDEAVAFVAELNRRFRPRRNELLAARAARRAEIAAGGSARLPAPRRPTCAPPTGRRPPRPADLHDRRVEITGPTERKMTINALNSGAKVWLADLEDANTPHWANVVDGQQNLLRRDPAHDHAGDRRRRRTSWAAGRTRRSSCGRAAGTWTSGTCRWTASRRSARWSTSGSTSSTTPPSCSRGAAGRTSTCPRWSRTRRRRSGTTSSRTPRRRSASRSAPSGPPC